MEEGDCFITWNDYSDHMKQMLQHLMKSQTFTDVTLVCDDKIQLEAHKIILISGSKFFEAILKPIFQVGDIKPIIYLKGINHHEMESILQFMYLGEARFSQERTSEFLRVAMELELKSISQIDKNNSQNEASVELYKESVITTQSKDHMTELNPSEQVLELNTNDFDEVSSDVTSHIKSNRMGNSNELNKSEELNNIECTKVALVESVELSPIECARISSDDNLSAQEPLEINSQNLETGIEVDCQSIVQTQEVVEAAQETELPLKSNTEKSVEIAIQSEQTYFIKEGDIKYECQICSQCFSDGIKLNLHNKEHHYQNTQNLICKCGFRAETKPDLDIHKLKSHKSKTCTKCDFTADTLSKIFKHFKNEHKALLHEEKISSNDNLSSQEPLEIKSQNLETGIEVDCQSIVQSEEVNLHYNEHHYQKTQNLICRCGFQAETKPDLDIHKLKSHKLKTCTKCNFTADTYSKIFQHLKSEHKALLHEEKQVHVKYPKNEKYSKVSDCDKSLVPLNTDAVNKLKSYDCDQCEYKAYKKPFLKRHVKTEHSTNVQTTFSCNKCEFTSSKKSHVRTHSSIKHNDNEWTKKKRYCCDKCEYKTDKTFHLKNHNYREHGKCIYCEFVSFEKSELNDHLHRNHQRHLSKDCDHCDYKATCKEKLRKHLKRNHSPFQCGKCTYSTFKRFEYDLHLDTKHTNKEVEDKIEFITTIKGSKEYICNECNYQTQLRVNVLKHVTSQHLNRNHSQFQCGKCKYSTYKKFEYDLHLDTKHANKEVEDKIELITSINGVKEFICNECNYQDHSRIHVLRHITAEHLGITHPCDQCGKEFTNSSNLNQHIKRKHTKNFAFQCDQCEKQFQYESRLKSHIRVKHLGVRHKCPKCKSQFPEINNLKKHYKIYHS